MRLHRLDIHNVADKTAAVCPDIQLIIPAAYIIPVSPRGYRDPIVADSRNAHIVRLYRTDPAITSVGKSGVKSGLIVLPEFWEIRPYCDYDRHIAVKHLFNTAPQRAVSDAPLGAQIISVLPEEKIYPADKSDTVYSERWSYGEKTPAKLFENIIIAIDRYGPVYAER